MRYCKTCGYVIDEFDPGREEESCSICSHRWFEDDMTALKYSKLSEQEKDFYDNQLLDKIKSSPKFDQSSYSDNCSTENGQFWIGFRVDKYAKFQSDQQRIISVLERRKKNEPFKPFEPIDEARAREIELEAEKDDEEFEREFCNRKSTQVNVPRCPICQSANLSKISSLKKATKIGLFGIFGAGDVGKTWKCNNCGSRF